MREGAKSYYKSTDLLRYNQHRKVNYVNLFDTPAEDAGHKEEDAYTEYDKGQDFMQIFSPVDYKIIPLSTVRHQETDNNGIESSNEGPDASEYPVAKRKYPSAWIVDDVISGLIHIMDQDPKLRGKFRITSLYRDGATTKSGKFSFHGIGKAVDIVPVDGTFDTLEADMMANKELVIYMIKNKIGILDEYTPNGHQAKTGATGNHMHIGPDQLALSDFKKLLNKYAIDIET